MRLSLSGEWNLSCDSIIITGNVPGDICDDVLKAGLISDPYFGYNYENATWIHKNDWVYKREFTIDSLATKGEITFLCLLGVDTYSIVFINGIFIGETANMHKTYRFPIDNAIKAGVNVIEIHMKNVYEQIFGKPQTKYDSIFCSERIRARKAQCHFGWDWAPDFGGYGIYREIYIERVIDNAIESVGITTELNGNVSFKIENRKKFSGEIKIDVFLNGEKVSSVKRHISNKRKIINLHIKSPKLWWPNGYGEHPVYNYTITQIVDGVELYEYKGTFGIRKVEIVQNVLDSDNIGFFIRFNERRIYCKGSNWVPVDCMTGRTNDDKYYKLVKAARDSNMNMLRVWGGGIYEKDCFYDYCDQMGIMVWQDFMFSCSEIPEDEPEFVNEITEEAVMQVKRLRNHPCLALWCGMNEVRGAFSDAVEERYSYFTLHYLLRGITGDLSPNIPYIRTSPFCFADTENDKSEGDTHENLSEICLFSESFKGFDEFTYKKNDENEMASRIKKYDMFVEQTKNNFSSECAVIGMCNYRSLIKFTPEDELKIDSNFFTKRFMGNPYAYVMPMFVDRQKKIAESMYGPIENIMDFVKKINKAQADILRTEIIYARTNGRSNGFLNWMYNDIWPTGTWSVIDYYLSKKPAYYAMKRYYVPMLTAIEKIGDKIFFCITNDSQNPLDYSGKISIASYFGQVVDQTRVCGTVEGDCGKMVEIHLNNSDGDYIVADGIYGGKPFHTCYNLGRYSGKSYLPKFTYEVTEDRNETYVILKAESFVPCLNIYAGEQADVEDNFFDMTAKETRKVKINGTVSEKVKVLTFFDQWYF